MTDIETSLPSISQTEASSITGGELSKQVEIPGIVQNLRREIALFAGATFAMGMAYALFDAVFNNYLNDQYSLSALERSFMELPRELPGFLVVFVSAALWFLGSRRLAALSALLGVIGVLLIGFVPSTYALLLVWLFIFNMGSHLFMPLAPGIGMELARAGHTGRRLGQFNSLRNLAAILGSGLVFIGFKSLDMTYQQTFALTAVGLGVATFLLWRMQPGERGSPRLFLKMHREYRWFYWLAVLFGTRKQLFITFAPWVLITIFDQPTTTIATLITVGGAIGILFQPLLGWAVDRFGERSILVTESLLLIVVCLGYGFSRDFFPAQIAFAIVCGSFMMDQLLMSFGIARSTYMKKIAKSPADVQPALTLSITIDHVFSITAALVGGLIWNRFGFQYVFLMGAGIAIVNLFVALQVRTPESSSAQVP